MVEGQRVRIALPTHYTDEWRAALNGRTGVASVGEGDMSVWVDFDAPVPPFGTLTTPITGFLFDASEVEDS